VDDQILIGTYVQKDDQILIGTYVQKDDQILIGTYVQKDESHETCDTSDWALEMTASCLCFEWNMRPADVGHYPC
jgi:hypothetical protein